MSLTPVMLDAMLAAGCTAEQIAAVVKADLAEREVKVAAKRENNAERQRRFKARHRSEVTPDNAGNALPDVTGVTSVTDPSLPLSSPQTPQHTPTHPCNNKPARTKGFRLPADWQPKPLTADLAGVVSQWPKGAVAREESRFRDWGASATGPNAVKTDWDAAWRNWLRKAEDDGRYGRRSEAQAANDVSPLLQRVRALKARESSA